MISNKKHIYSKEEDQFLIENVKYITLKELTNKFNNKFKLNVTESAIGNRKNKLGLKSEIVGGQFKKGNVSWNIGTKGLTKGNITSFKKGNIPANSSTLGTVRVDKYGYTYIKIQNGCRNRNWKLKSILIYEEKNGKVPKGYNVIFLDGNKQNFDINNLEAVSKNQNRILNANKLRFEEIDTTKSGIKVAELIEMIQKKKRGN